MSLIGKILAYPVLTINLAVGMLLTISAYGSLLPPFGDMPLLSLSGLAFPFLFAGNLAFLAIWLVFKKKFAILPLIFIIVTAVPAYRYCPVHLRKSKTGPDITLVSYNTRYFGAPVGGSAKNASQVLQYACSLGGDIVCFQEAVSTTIEDEIKEGTPLFESYPYQIVQKYVGLACISKYPIISHEIVDFEDEKSNKCMIMELLVGSDTVTVFNCHFQSNHLDPADFEATHQDDALTGSKRILSKLLSSTSQRAKQSRMIAELAKNTHGKVIVTGDFNDTPLSYSHHQFDRYLTDCYTKAGNGPGISYNMHHLYYRIDHVFCSSHFSPIRCRIDRGCDKSDHYPIIVELKYN